MSNIERTKIGAAIKSARKALGITQERFAERIGVSTRYTMQLESSQSMPSCALLFRIIRELNIDPNLIFYPEKATKDSEMDDLLRMLYKCDERSMQVIRATVKAALESQIE